MSGGSDLEGWKNIIWNVLMFVFAFVLLFVGWYFGSSLINDGLSLKIR